jgi:acyl-CoA reductase-like NAD-dependent aldehyde dehydrogenase
MLQDPDLLALQEVRTKVENAWAASQKYRNFTQEQIDTVVERMAAAGRQHAQRLADLAVEETGYGNARDKLAKNLLAADLLARRIRGMKTVGVLKECPERQVVEIAVPMGVIAAILPTTNPTSTAIYKILISLKAGNAIVLSPHPRAKRCTCETAEVLYQAAREAGAPENIIQCIDSARIEATNELMRHRRTGAILSTGGSGIVKAAYSSGKPAFGVGPGNVPVVIDRSANIADAVAKTVEGKSFDYGTLCSSEQTVIAEESIREQVLAAFRARKAFLCNDQQRAALTRVLLVPPRWGVNPDCVGQAPAKIARMAGFEVPPDTSIIVCEIAGVGPQHPLSAEKLSPVLALLFVKDFNAALDAAEAVLQFHGLGHTCGIYSRDESRTRAFALRMPSMRVLCNTPAPQGSVGITTNLMPAMTLGCGAIAGNITGDNIGPKHLINIKRLAYSVREASEAFQAEPAVAAAAVAATPVTSSVKAQISDAVERFLAGRGMAANNPASPPETRAARPPSAATPSPAPAEFVSEDDVRAAIRVGRKIHIGPKTIVTPLARELASEHDTFVVAKRK